MELVSIVRHKSHFKKCFYRHLLDFVQSDGDEETSEKKTDEIHRGYRKRWSHGKAMKNENPGDAEEVELSEVHALRAQRSVPRHKIKNKIIINKKGATIFMTQLLGMAKQPKE